MRLATVADIHGNPRALEAMVTDLKRSAPDLVINLSDCVPGPPEAGDSAGLLIHLGCASMRGNHDRRVVEKPRSAMGKSDLHVADKFAPRYQLWLAALPTRLAPLPGVAAFHGPPAEYNRYLTEEVHERRDVLRAITCNLHDLANVVVRLVLVGHSPQVLALSCGCVAFIPGSSGCIAPLDTDPIQHVMETGSPHARYSIQDWTHALANDYARTC